MRFQGPEALDVLWRETGLREVQTAPLDVTVEYEDFDDFWLPFEGRIGPAGEYLASLDPGAQVEVRDACFHRLGEPVGPFTLHARAWAVRGTR
ncbi:MAG: SAM-dependent methyltransferase, partial [Gaiellaceae bacterium]